MSFVTSYKYKIRSLKNYLGISKKTSFNGSKNYWESRYKNNSNSGSGSYGKLAAYKAEVLNDFVLKNNIQTVVELGCGDGNQLKLANYSNYIGFDVSEKAISLCQKMFKKDNSKQFKHYDAKTFHETNNGIKADLVMSLDVIYHLIEDEVFEDHMQSLFSTSNIYVIIYSSNYNDHFVAHVKCREFTSWIEKNVNSEWEQINIIKNKYPFDKKDPSNTSMSDFYIYKKRA